MAKLTGGRLAAARAFKAARGRKGLSQKSLATASGVALGVIQNLEAGATWPNATSQAKLEPAVGLPAGELERIAGAYAEQGHLIDQETELLERLTEVQRERRDGPAPRTQQEAEAILQHQRLYIEGLQARIRLLRDAVREGRGEDVDRLSLELEQLLLNSPE